MPPVLKKRLAAATIRCAWNLLFLEENVVNGVCAKMKKKYMLVLFALMMIVLVTAFVAIQSKSGDLPVRAVLLIAATCLPPLGILFYTSSKIKRSSNKL